MPLRQEVAEQLTGEWQVGLCEAPCSAPCSFCYGCCCICCMAGQQRLQILDVIGEPYVCCGGLFPCGPCGEEQDRCCVWAEACCCPGLAVSGNRFLIQTRFDRQNTACDDCILWSMCLASCAVCLCKCMGCEVPEELENCVDCMKSVVDGCMLAQQQVEIDHVQKTGFQGPNPVVVAMLPPHQQHMILQGRPGGMVAVAAGAMVGGAAGAAVMYPAGVHPVALAPVAQAMGYPAPGTEPRPPACFGVVGPAIPMSQAGFMNTMAPSGVPWWQHCQGPVCIDPASGLLAGPWGECLAWSKIFELRNPGWEADPQFAGGPCGQVIASALAACPQHLRCSVEQAANHLESACDQAAACGAPLPIIFQQA